MFPKKSAQNFTLCHIWYTSHRIQKLSFSNTSQISSLTLLCINHVLWSEAQTSHHNIPSFSMPVKKLCSLPEDGVPLTRTPTLPVSVCTGCRVRLCMAPKPLRGRSVQIQASLCSFCAPAWPFLSHYKSTFAASFSVTADHFWTFSRAIHCLLSITSFNWLNHFHSLHS